MSARETSGGAAKVTFEPTGRTVHVLPGTSVVEAAGRAGLTIDTPCGGAGTCGKCRVRFIHGCPAASEAGAGQLGEDELASGWRLACQVAVERDAVIAIPETSLFAEQIQILTETTKIEEASAENTPTPRVTCPLPIVAGEENYAVAFDVGTTTLVGELLELPGGASREVAAGINPQVSFGDDVVSRIGRACESPAASAELRETVRESLHDLVGTLCESACVARGQVRGVSFAGNTTMQHLLCGLDVTGLSALPFEPERYGSCCLRAEELGIEIAPDGRAYVMPVIGGFVGGDTVSGILTTRMDAATGPTLMIDIGTNGEIVLAWDGQMLAASAAAGPAFEGARIACGMRAAAGAIEKVVFDGEVRYSTIGGAEPIGICGSALVDVAAEMLRAGAIEATGRIVQAGELPEARAGLAGRLREGDKDAMEFVLHAGSNGRPDVVITQKDIRELQLATGALRAGVQILLKQAGLKAEDLERVLIAGGFGSFIRRDNAQAIGLIPHEVDPGRIGYVGNVSLHGAKWALVSEAARTRAEAIPQKARHVELSSDTDFQMAFAEAMLFPTT